MDKKHTIIDFLIKSVFEKSRNCRRVESYDMINFKNEENNQRKPFFVTTGAKYGRMKKTKELTDRYFQREFINNGSKSPINEAKEMVDDEFRVWHQSKVMVWSVINA